MDGSSNFAVEQLSLDLLANQISSLACELNSTNHRWLTLIGEFDRRRGWADDAFVSCAHWLNFKCGVDLGAAREKVRVAHALTALPKISTAMGDGRLSYSKVRALTRVASATTEDYFLSVALLSSAQHVERFVRQYRRGEQELALSREECQVASRELHWWFDEDGSVLFKVRLPAVSGALMIKALEAARDQIYKQDVSAETSEASLSPLPNFAMQRADALALVAESYLNDGVPADRNTDRYQVIVHVDSQTLASDGEGRCEIEDGSPIAAETARRIACDASRIVVTENEKGEPLDIGRKTRTIPPAMRRALTLRDRGCQFPGCTHSRFLDAHHVQHWAAGGETALSNLVMLCRFHHRTVHEGGIRISRSNQGALIFIRPDGRAYETNQTQRPPSTSMQVPVTNAASSDAR